MALKDFLALADDELSKVYHKAEFNVEKARTALVARLDKVKEQFGNPEPSKGKKMWKVNRNVVELTLPVSIGGKSTLYLPAERFLSAIDHLQKSIKGGELDSELENSMTANDDTPRTRAPRAPRAAGSGGGKGWTEERRQRYAETIAARKAGK